MNGQTDVKSDTNSFISKGEYAKKDDGVIFKFILNFYTLLFVNIPHNNHSTVFTAETNYVFFIRREA